MQTTSDRILAEMLATMQDLKTEVMQLRDIVTKQPTNVEGWAIGRKAAVSLRAEGVRNEKHLTRLRHIGAFTEGRDIRNVSPGTGRPTWEYHVPSCRKTLQRYFKDLNRE